MTWLCTSQSLLSVPGGELFLLGIAELADCAVDEVLVERRGAAVGDIAFRLFENGVRRGEEAARQVDRDELAVHRYDRVLADGGLTGLVGIE